MSATHRSESSAQQPLRAPAPRDISVLHSRRREANRRRRLLRVDVGLGVLAGIVLLLATPGLAIAAIFAGILLVVCVISVLLQRRRERRERQSARRRA
jgi:Flp pilus assembly protein TadB